MNWYKIYKKYPMAFKAMVEHFDKTHMLLSTKELKNYLKESGKSDWMSSIYFRDLYDFFDSVNIKVETLTDLQSHKWDCIINDHYVVKEGFSTRKKAEVEGFKKAFELLEKQLLIDLLNKD